MKDYNIKDTIELLKNPCAYNAYVAVAKKTAEEYKTVSSERSCNTTRKCLMIICPEEFCDFELLELKKLSEGSGAHISIASTNTDMAVGSDGSVIKPEMLISNVKVENFDAFILVGGKGSKEFLWDNRDLLQLVKKAHKGGKIIAAINTSAVVLARAGVLKDKPATVYPYDEGIAELKSNGAQYLNESIVVWGNIITAYDPMSSSEFGLRLVSILKRCI